MFKISGKPHPPLATPSRYITPVFAYFMRRDGLGVSQRRCDTNSWPEAQRRRRWRACNVTSSPLLVIAVEWPDPTARSAPRPSTVSGSMGGPSCCRHVFKTLPSHAIHINFHLLLPPPPPFVSSDFRVHTLQLRRSCTLTYQGLACWMLVSVIHYQWLLLSQRWKLYCPFSLSE